MNLMFAFYLRWTTCALPVPDVPIKLQRLEEERWQWLLATRCSQLISRLNGPCHPHSRGKAMGDRVVCTQLFESSNCLQQHVPIPEWKTASVRTASSNGTTYRWPEDRRLEAPWKTGTDEIHRSGDVSNHSVLNRWPAPLSREWFNNFAIFSRCPLTLDARADTRHCLCPILKKCVWNHQLAI